MGSAALHHLARRGKRVLGLERHSPGHDRGSSHGSTRIIRLGYFEHPTYVPLLRRAYALWRELETAAGRRLLHVTGIAEIGPPSGTLVQGTLASARLHELQHEVLPAPELMRRFPAFRLPRHYVAVLQPDGGFLEAEPSIAAHLALASAAGADIRSGETVRAIEPGSGFCAGDHRSRHGRGRRGHRGGGRMDQIAVAEVRRTLRVTREVMGWFAVADNDLSSAGQLPVFIIESRHGMHYGIPAPHGASGRTAIKVAKHHHRNETVDPDALRSNRVGGRRGIDPLRHCGASPNGKWGAHRRHDLPLHHDPRRSTFSSTICPAPATSLSPRHVRATGSSSRR